MCVEVAAVQDIDAGQVTSRQIVCDEQGSMRALHVCLAVLNLGVAEPGRGVVLGGVKIECGLALMGRHILRTVAWQHLAHASFASSVKLMPVSVRALS